MTDRDYFIRARQTQPRQEPQHNSYAQTYNRGEEAYRGGNHADNARQAAQAQWERELGQYRRAAGGEVHRSSAHRIARQESADAHWEQESRQRQQSYQRAAGRQDDVGRSRMAADLAAARGRR